jgi:hypothetical protein
MLSELCEFLRLWLGETGIRGYHTQRRIRTLKCPRCDALAELLDRIGQVKAIRSPPGTSQQTIRCRIDNIPKSITDH